MIQTISYITENKSDFLSTRLYFERNGINLVQTQLNLRQVQGDDILQVAKEVTKDAAAQFNKPLIVVSRGFSITHLAGFPGIDLDSFNRRFTPSQILKLMEGATDRSAKYDFVVGLSLPKDEVRIYHNQELGVVPEVLFPDDLQPTTQQLFIPNDSKLPLSQMDEESLQQFWLKTPIWSHLIGYLKIF